MFVLFNVIFGVAAMVLDNVLGLAARSSATGRSTGSMHWP